jgi:hypothetical protein
VCVCVRARTRAWTTWKRFELWVTTTVVCFYRKGVAVLMQMCWDYAVERWLRHRQVVMPGVYTTYVPIILSCRRCSGCDGLAILFGEGIRGS